MHFEILDPSPLVDAPVGFKVAGVPQESRVEVTAVWAHQNVRFAASGHFVATSNGIVDPATQPAFAGTYEGVDPFGLWWSAQTGGPIPRPAGLDTLITELSARVDGFETAFATLQRRKIAQGVRQVEVSDGGLVALFFCPDEQVPLPGVMVFGGSGGGLEGAETTGALLASHGFATLAIAYFGMSGLPAGLVEVPLEYLQSGLRWLLRQPQVRGPQVGVMGGSRGGELALLLGAHFQEVGAVVAKVPSGVMWSGFDANGTKPGVSAWTLDGKALPMMPRDNTQMWAAVKAVRPVVLTPAFLADLEDTALARSAEIPVEHTQGPILLISGRDDAMWPSTPMAEIAVRRARAHGFRHSITHLSYPDAGHFCASPPGLPLPTRSIHPVDRLEYVYGGTPHGNAAARTDSWNASLLFLRKALSI